MEQQTTRTPSRPLFLLGKPGESLTALRRTRSLRDGFVVATPESSSVEDLLSALKPTALLLEASEFYLEGRALSARLHARSRGSRIVFLDVDRAWALWMEPETGEGRDLRIAPCLLEHAGEGLKDLLAGSEDVLRPAEFAVISLEPAG